VKRGEWEELVRKREALSGEQFNGSTKKAIFLDKAPSSIKTMLQMQNLNTYAEMVSTTLQ